MSLEDLEKRVRVLEDIEEIKRLKARYCANNDRNTDPDRTYDADSIVKMFTEDAVFDLGMKGRFEGREKLRNLFTTAPQTASFSLHMVMNPVIEVDGDTAKGTWYLFNPLTLVEGNRAAWGSARYDEEYVRVDGEWKFKSIKLTSIFRTPFDQGWAKNRSI